MEIKNENKNENRNENENENEIRDRKEDEKESKTNTEELSNSSIIRTMNVFKIVDCMHTSNGISAITVKSTKNGLV